MVFYNHGFNIGGCSWTRPDPDGSLVCIELDLKCIFGPVVELSRFGPIMAKDPGLDQLI